MSSQGMKDKLKEYFTKPPFARSVFYLSARTLSGIHISRKERRIKHHFITPLEGGLIEPSFSKKNIENEPILERRMKEGLAKLHLNDTKTACLIPELSLKAFVFAFDSLPTSKHEREQIIRFRIKKQMAFLPDDARLSFDVIKYDHSQKVIVSIARASIISEYEDFFRRIGFKVSLISSPLLSLYNLIRGEREGVFLLANIEEESLGLLAIIDSEIALYRQKPLGFESEDDIPSPQRLEEIIKEIENTANYVEDREKRKITSLLVRLGQVGTEEKSFSQLRTELSFPIDRIDVSLASDIAVEERQFLAPLIGQML